MLKTQFDPEQEGFEQTVIFNIILFYVNFARDNYGLKDTDSMVTKKQKQKMLTF